MRRGIKRFTCILLLPAILTGFIVLHRVRLEYGITSNQSQLEYTFYIQETSQVSVVRVHTKKQADKLEKGNSNILGKTISFSADNFDIDIYADSLRLNDLSETQLENIKLYYGYSPLVNEILHLNKKPVNIQIAINETTNRVTIGMPIIFGSY